MSVSHHSLEPPHLAIDKTPVVLWSTDYSKGKTNNVFQQSDRRGAREGSNELTQSDELTHSYTHPRTKQVLATLVTAEANAKGETGSPMSMKAWLEMQVSLAAKNKLAVAEAAAMDESGRDAKRPKTRSPLFLLHVVAVPAPAPAPVPVPVSVSVCVCYLLTPTLL